MSDFDPPPRNDRPEDPMSNGLFRAEAVCAQHNDWLGATLNEGTGVSRILLVLCAITVLCITLLLAFGTMSRKSALVGGLRPERGLARIVAPQAGTISVLNVHEGSIVRKGMPLLSISSEVQTTNSVEARESVVRSLQSRQDSISRAALEQDVLSKKQSDEIEARLQLLRQELPRLEREVILQKARVTQSNEKVARETEMRNQGLITLPRLERSRDEQLDQSSRLSSLERAVAALKRDLVTAENQLQSVPNSRKIQTEELARARMALEQDLAEAEARRSIVVTAPSSGTVSSLDVEVGTSIGANATLMTIVPENPTLQAVLYAPSSGMGFVKPGQRVKLRVHAFPYQKFGFLDAEIVSVAQAAAAPAEFSVDPRVSRPSSSPEPIFKIVAKLSSQSVRAYGQDVELRSGMQVDADVMLEKRSLLAWIFDPLVAITGRWGAE